MLQQSSKQNWIVFKKSEKLATAIHMLTDFFDDKESLKWHLREESVSFLSFVNSFVHNPGSRILPSEIEAHIQGVLSLLALGRSSRLISPMNFSILKEEYRLIARVLYENIESKEGSSDFEFPEKFFSEKIPHGVSAHAEDSEGEQAVKDRNFSTKNHIKDFDENRDFNAKTHDFYGDSSSVYKKGFRREAILKILRTKGEITIKDIAYLVKGISEKTIQRELISLIDEGVVRREGKRRWSKYLLKHDTHSI